jgi:hypothetical protein
VDMHKLDFNVCPSRTIFSINGLLVMLWILYIVPSKFVNGLRC